MPESPHSEAPAPAPIRASGTRRINLDMRARLDQADRFTGLPRGTAKPFTFLAAFQQAEPYLGLPAHSYKLLSWLVSQTKPQELGRRQPADFLAVRAAPGGISGTVDATREGAQSRAVRSGNIRDPRQPARKTLRPA